MQTSELILSLAIVFITIPAPTARSAGVSWVDDCQRYSVQPTLVLDKTPELTKRPSTHPGALLLAKPYALANALQILQGDAARRVLGLKHQGLADDVVNVPPESSLLASKSPKRSSCVFSRTASFACRGFFQHRATRAKVLNAHPFNGIAAYSLAVARGCYLCNTEINANKGIDFNQCRFRGVDCGKQIEPAISKHQIALPFQVTKLRLLVCAKCHGNNLTACDCQDAYAVGALETKDAIVIRHSAVWLKAWTSPLISGKALGSFPHGAHGHLARQSELRPKIPIASGLYSGLAKYSVIEPYASGMGGGVITRTHRRQQQSALFERRQNLHLQRHLHAYSLEQKH